MFRREHNQVGVFIKPTPGRPVNIIELRSDIWYADCCARVCAAALVCRRAARGGLKVNNGATGLGENG